MKEKIAPTKKANQDSSITQYSGVVGASLSELHMYIYIGCVVLGAILYIAYNIRIYYTLVRQFWPPGCELALGARGQFHLHHIQITHKRCAAERGACYSSGCVRAVLLIPKVNVTV